MSKTMKAVVKNASWGASLQDVAIPRCEKNGVLVKILASAICGSDVHRYLWEPSKGNPAFRIPVVMGHELCGEILEVGSDVQGLVPGQIVTADTHIPCGRCYQCLNGMPHICNNLRVFGSSTDGCFSEYYAFPAICARPIPAGITPEEGALLEPMGVAYHALSKSGHIAGDSVAIVGCGAIGLMTVALAKILGAAQIIAVSRSRENLERALAFGATHIVSAKEWNAPSEAVLRLTDGYGAGTVIELSGNVGAFEDALQMPRKGGAFVAASMPQQKISVDFSMQVARRELTIYGFHGRRMFETWTAVENLIAAGKLKLSPFITAQMPLEEFSKAFEMAQSSAHIKVILKP